MTKTTFDLESARRIARATRLSERQAPASRVMSPLGERSFQGGGYLVTMLEDVPPPTTHPGGFFQLHSGRAKIIRRYAANNPDTGTLQDTYADGVGEITVTNHNAYTLSNTTTVRAIQDAYGTFWGFFEGVISQNLLAAIDVPIPGRVSRTEPGKGVATLMRYDPVADALVADIGVNVLSWVATPTADPADEPDGILYIWLELSLGTDNQWYYFLTAQDCEEEPPAFTVVPDGGTVPDDGTEVIYVL